MNIPTPWNLIGRILKWAWNQITSFWLLKTYKQSHEYEAKRLRLGSYWEKLGEHLEYSLRLANPADHESIKSKVAFRSKKGTLKSATLFFEAAGNGIRYQQKIELINLDENAIIVTLDQTPKQDMMKSSKPGLFFTIKEIRFVQCVVTLHGNHQCPPFDSLTSYLSHNWLLNDKWERRWGVLWNCNAIEYAKIEISGYWRWRLGEYRYFSLFHSRSERISIQALFRKSLCRVLIHPYMLTLQFWLAIHSGRYRLGDGKLIHKRYRK
ncbi:hypothetical protein AB204_05225 [Xenorhabdus khoisanae]|uniref:Uncharacterized protein n=1 Tax=Xenorhabdus khoisanae TaxID=880157 RepID=A0A0J5FVJ5_9GAMM|nr:hypothetical protein [Xenorhabdus khoisanae]KMJ46199.1 hypothetical protein AB204_05225 [Xenorhabdus khoisanae]